MHSLSVNILTRNSERRLEPLLRQVSQFADQILVGVDASSTDQTAKIAAAHADVVYFFRHSGQLASARMLPFKFATGDWILSLDDDELLETSFGDLLPQLLANGAATHFWFPRKCIVNSEPLEFLAVPPWFPDWQLRLFRNDARLVRKPPRVHSGYHVQGPGYHESRTSILHFEPLWCVGEERATKLARYRKELGAGAWEAQYAPSPDIPRRLVEVNLPVTEHRKRSRKSVTYPAVHEEESAPQPAWRADVISVKMPDSSRRLQHLFAEVNVRNTGSMAWGPTWGLRNATINLGYHLLDAGGNVVQWDCERCSTQTLVWPNEEVTYFPVFRAPAKRGNYILEWDMVSENECWFSATGGTTFRTTLRIVS